jgi:hypothetical protein
MPTEAAAVSSSPMASIAERAIDRSTRVHAPSGRARYQRRGNRLATKLFRKFAQFEYALKAAGYLRCGRDNAAEPDWTEFAKSIPAVFDAPDEPGLAEAVRFILAEPPKKQVVVNGRLEWSVAAPEGKKQSDLVLIYVRRVRNNLFHGGKFNEKWFAPDRSEPLIRHARLSVKIQRNAAVCMT